MGGNFYANSTGTGFSETCASETNGICDDYYNMSVDATEHIDWLPLVFGGLMCSPSLDVDWEITDAQVCDQVEVTTGTGSIRVLPGGNLTLINTANVTTSKLELNRTGDSVFINDGTRLIME